jgi:hypothetical protein
MSMLQLDCDLRLLAVNRRTVRQLKMITSPALNLSAVSHRCVCSAAVASVGSKSSLLVLA